MAGSALGNTLYAEYQSGWLNQSWTNMKSIDYTKIDFVEYVAAPASAPVYCPPSVSCMVSPSLCSTSLARVSCLVSPSLCSTSLARVSV